MQSSGQAVAYWMKRPQRSDFVSKMARKKVMIRVGCTFKDEGTYPHQMSKDIVEVLFGATIRLDMKTAVYAPEDVIRETRPFQ